MVALLIVAACGTNTADVDLWGHLRSGADMIAGGHLPVHDPYAYSVNAPIWINHEYLSEAIFAWMYMHLGVVGLKLVRFVCASVMIVSIAGAVAETSAAIPIQFIVLDIGRIQTRQAGQIQVRGLDHQRAEFDEIGHSTPLPVSTRTTPRLSNCHTSPRL